MGSKTRPKTAKYLYAVVNGNGCRSCESLGIGDKAVYTIQQGSMAAVVSDVPAKRLRPERRNLAAHQQVLNTLMKEQTPLPVSFGIIAGTRGAVKTILSRNQKVLKSVYRKVKGKMEMSLRVSWDVPNIFSYFVNTHPELRQARDRIYGSRGEPSQDGKLELGRMFDQLLNAARDNHTDMVEEILAGCCVEVRRNPCKDEVRVMDLACLVDRDREASFEKGIFEAANLFDNNFTFDYSGPWVPHSFVNIELDL